MPDLPFRSYLSCLKQIPSWKSILWATTGAHQLDNATIDILSQLDVNRAPHLDLKKRIATSGPAQGLLEALPPQHCLRLSDLTDLRKRVAAALTATKTETNLKRASRVYNCNQAFMVAYSEWRDSNESNPWQLIPYSCNSRICPECNERKSNLKLAWYMTCLQRNRYAPMLSPRANRLKFLTLTVKNCPAGRLAGHIKALLQAFRQFRRKSGTWQHVRGYIWTLETTWSRGWHPHIHCLIDSDFIPLPQLTADWAAWAKRQGLKALPNAQEIKAVRRAPDCENDTLAIHSAVWECVKYPTKPIDLDKIPAGNIIELIDALHNKRIHGTAGTLQIPAEDKTPEWEIIGGLKHELDDPESPIWQSQDTLACLLESCPPDQHQALISRYPYFGALHLAGKSDKNPDETP